MGFEIEPVEPKNGNLGLEPYPEDTVDKALLALALKGGNATAAARLMRATGEKVSADAISNWRDKYPQRYAYHCTENVQAIENGIAANQRELVTAAAQASLDAIKLEHERILDGEVKDASASARNLQTIAGIGVTKVLEITGRPTAIIEHRRPEDVVRRLNALVVDSDAEEVSDKNV